MPPTSYQLAQLGITVCYSQLRTIIFVDICALASDWRARGSITLTKPSAHKPSTIHMLEQYSGNYSNTFTK